MEWKLFVSGRKTKIIFEDPLLGAERPKKP
jgi:hypothetical protein